ncbi:MAG: hypothetical protein H8E41_02785 [Desulfobulbaceae bacterium]|uniref:Uncharacterized protein n=1 Tax=Candidatus Desulfobia pelagia TaxID=2841692 RepID=A0A8J6NCQ6_9BACT|nr:hypothetical protein [Candidatus Desulfobia pelagia]
MSSLNVSDGAEAIQELKAAIQTIEWEITDKAIETLIDAIGPLREKWAGQKAFLVCLQIIGTLGGYLKTARQKAHPDTTKLLHSVFDTLDLVVTDSTMSDKEKTEKVRVEVAKYNELKVKIAAPPTPAPVKEVPKGESDFEAPAGQSETIKTLMEDRDKTAEEPFNDLYKEMVKDEQKPAPSSAPAMPSPQKPAGGDEKEVVLDRIDDEIFPEADQLIDDFFAEDEDEPEISPVVEEAAPGEETPEGEEIVEFTLTRVPEEEEAEKEAAADEEFRSQIEAEIALRLDFEGQEEDAAEIETEPVIVDKEPEAPSPEAVSPDLDAIIDSFASELAAALTAQIKKRVEEEIKQLRSALSEEKKNDTVK